jgi:hypothetical protein
VDGKNSLITHQSDVAANNLFTPYLLKLQTIRPLCPLRAAGKFIFLILLTAKGRISFFPCIICPKNLTLQTLP